MCLLLLLLCAIRSTYHFIIETGNLNLTMCNLMGFITHVSAAHAICMTWNSCRIFRDSSVRLTGQQMWQGITMNQMFLTLSMGCILRIISRRSRWKRNALWSPFHMNNGWGQLWVIIISRHSFSLSSGTFWMIRTTCNIQGLRKIVLITVENVIDGFRCIIPLKVWKK